ASAARLPAGTRAAFTGVAFPGPGLFEAEDFDNGGEGVTYHDLTLGNQGGLYRTNVDVDMIAATGNATGYVVNSFETGEWLEYTISVASSEAVDDIPGRIAGGRIMSTRSEEHTSELQSRVELV